MKPKLKIRSKGYTATNKSAILHNSKSLQHSSIQQ